MKQMICYPGLLMVVLNLACATPTTAQGGNAGAGPGTSAQPPTDGAQPQTPPASPDKTESQPPPPKDEPKPASPPQAAPPAHEVAAKAAEDKAEAVIKELNGKRAGLKSMTAKVKMSTAQSTGHAAAVTESAGTYELIRKEGKTSFRMDLKMVTTLEINGKKSTIPSSTLSLGDGSTVYTLSDQAGTRLVTKTNADYAPPFEFESVFAKIREDHRFSVLPDQSVDGQVVYVLQATPQTPSPIAKQLFYLAKETGDMLKQELYALNDKVFTTILFSDIKHNGDIPADRFVFKAPRGVKIIDLTGSSD